MSTKSKFGYLKANYRDRSWWKGLLIRKIGVRYFSYSDEGESVWVEDWDNLIILDDCRYDLFKELYEESYGEKVQKRISKGSSTAPFLKANFGDGSFKEFVYVSANPFVSRLIGDRFGSVNRVWDFGWDDEKDVVTPEAVYTESLRIIRDSPDKKLIVHFLQPHSPYPNRTGQMSSKKDFKDTLTGVSKRDGPTVDCHIGGDRFVRWPHIGLRRLPAEDMWDGYVENLKWVLPYARRLTDFLPGTTVITSDHGEAFGERISPFFPLRLYGHPDYIRTKVTVTVPWVVIEEGDKEDSNLDEELQSAEKQFGKQKPRDEEDRVRDRVRALKRKGKL